MIQLTPPINNKPLYFAIGIAFVLHFIFTLTFKVAFEPAVKTPVDLTVTMVDNPVQDAQQKSQQPPKAEESQIIIHPEIKQAIPAPDQDRIPKHASNYIDNLNWKLSKEMDKKQMVLLLFGQSQSLSALKYGFSENLAHSRFLVEPQYPSCSELVKHNAYKHCPKDQLQLASVRPLQQKVHAIPPQFTLPYNDVIERPGEDWARLAGLPTFSAHIF